MTFPLPDGICRVVCRPKRKKPRRFTWNDVARIAGKIEGIDKQEGSHAPAAIRAALPTEVGEVLYTLDTVVDYIKRADNFEKEITHALQETSSLLGIINGIAWALSMTPYGRRMRQALQTVEEVSSSLSGLASGAALIAGEVESYTTEFQIMMDNLNDIHQMFIQAAAIPASELPSFLVHEGVTYASHALKDYVDEELQRRVDELRKERGTYVK